jgi:drug/metabolite transporter superfamily protein YnfA
MVCGIVAESGLSGWRLEIGIIASECLVCAYRVGRNCRLLLAMAGSEAGRQLVAAFARRRFPGAIVAALIWLRVVDGVPLTRWDVSGAALALAGMAVIALQPS